MIRAEIAMVILPQHIREQFHSTGWEVRFSETLLAYYISKSFTSITKEELETKIRSIIPHGTECWWLSSFETVS